MKATLSWLPCSSRRTAVERCMPTATSCSLSFSQAVLNVCWLIKPTVPSCWTSLTIQHLTTCWTPLPHQKPQLRKHHLHLCQPGTLLQHCLVSQLLHNVHYLIDFYINTFCNFTLIPWYMHDVLFCVLTCVYLTQKTAKGCCTAMCYAYFSHVNIAFFVEASSTMLRETNICSYCLF